MSRMGRNNGSGGRGAAGFFGMGKANVTNVDTKAKDKVGVHKLFKPGVGFSSM